MMEGRKQKQTGFLHRKSEIEILSETIPGSRLIVPGLEGPQIIFDKAELGRRVMEAYRMFGDESVSLRQPRPEDVQPDQSS